MAFKWAKGKPTRKACEGCKKPQSYTKICRGCSKTQCNILKIDPYCLSSADLWARHHKQENNHGNTRGNRPSETTHDASIGLVQYSVVDFL